MRFSSIFRWTQVCMFFLVCIAIQDQLSRCFWDVNNWLNRKIVYESDWSTAASNAIKLFSKGLYLLYGFLRSHVHSLLPLWFIMWTNFEKDTSEVSINQILNYIGTYLHNKQYLNKLHLCSFLFVVTSIR